MAPTQLAPAAAERFVRRRVRCAALLSTLIASCYAALVLGMAAWPDALRLFWGSELYSLGMALVAVNVIIGAALSILYVRWMPRQSQRDA
jgi:hypothetical protein